MEENYCPECGTKIKKDSNFCDNCGYKLTKKENKTKFCSNCGEKIDINAEICPKCGVRLINPITNSANDILASSQEKVDEGIDKIKPYITLKNGVIVLLIIIFLALLINAPSIIDHLTPYKQVDSAYVANPVAGEKVQFDGEYVGHTGWGAASYFLFYNPITDNDVVKVGNEYVILQGDYLTHDLSGHEGSKVHLEGRFAKGGASKEKMSDGNDITGHWFGAHTIEIIN